MKLLSVAGVAKKWDMSERNIRNYCNAGRIEGAFLTGKTWNIPETAEKPSRKIRSDKNASTLLEVLQLEKSSKVSGGIYHKLQIELTYNSNHIEGSRLTHDQTRYIYETNTIGNTTGVENETINVDDIVETANHFRCIDMAIESANANLSELFIRKLHATLKNGTSDSRKEYFVVGDYKKMPNEVGGSQTTAPELVSSEIKSLLNSYHDIKSKTIEDLIDFHYRFEKIHPFQDGNGRVGRLILLKECLKNNIVPFIIDERLKLFYYRGLKEWTNEKGFLIDTCLSAQDKFKEYLDYFKIWYK